MEISLNYVIEQYLYEHENINEDNREQSVDENV
jgi:hypothetical protein